MAEPLYSGLVAELGDPEQIAQEFDEHLIRWHAKRMRRGEGRVWTAEEIDALQRDARAEAAGERHGSALGP